MGIENIISQDFINNLSGLLPVFFQVMPEFLLLCLATMVLLVDAYLPRKVLTQEAELTNGFKVENYRFTFFLTNFVLLIIFVLLVIQNSNIFLPLSQISNDETTSSLINNMVVNDGLSYILKLFMVLFVFFSFYFSESYLTKNNMFSGEYYAMGLFSLLGMMVLVSSQNMLSLYIGLELFSLPVYAMVAMQRESLQSGEAALKYFVMGAIASSILLFGISLIYGMSGSLVLSEIASYKGSLLVPYTLGLVFICVGIVFKFGAAPFHMWMPDVYQGAPTPVTLFIATAPKLAATGMAIRLLNEGFFEISSSWGVILQMLALLSIAWGNIAAISQTNLKRLLAYSGISHMGFIILGFVSASMVNNGGAEGYSAALFYSITYALVSLAAFGFILMLGDGKYELTTLEDYKGLYYRKPWFALLLLILLLSMAGIPPFVGFFAKLLVIKNLLASGYIYSSVAAVLFTVIGVFYYLRLVWLMFFEKSSLELQRDKLSLQNDVMSHALSHVSTSRQFVISLICFFVLALGLYGQWLFNWCFVVFQ